ncbi:DUF1566 domain-containing protein, partial [bacterium]|nr:DUF1566 domain-containing protein [bacterium]
FSIKVTELEINTTYYIRAYAINEAGIGYGNEIKLEFNAEKPIVQTKETTNINIAGGTATFNGSITSIGDPAYTERGFVYATVHNPTVEDDTKKVATGNGTGDFSANVSELEMNKIYYVRAYALSSQSISYGNEVTLDFSQVLPVVTTQAVSHIDATTATFNGEVESIGDPAYTERGFIYGKMPVPTLEEAGVLTVSASGTGTGAYVRSVSDLETGKTYYVRAYTKVGTLMVYGNIVSFIAKSYYVTLSNGLVVAKEDADDGAGAPWDTAKRLCNNSNLAGFTDWRLPTKNELVTMYDNKNTIGNFKSGYYWSSSTKSDSTDYAWYVGFNLGYVRYGSKTDDSYVRCVR